MEEKGSKVDGHTSGTISKVVRLQDAKFSELGQVPLVDYLCAFDRLAMLISGPILLGWWSESVALGLAAFFALRFVGLKFDQQRMGGPK